MSRIFLTPLVFFIIFFLMYGSVLIGHKFGKWQISTTSNHKLKTNNNDAYELLLPTLMAMFAAANTQFAISYVHPPLAIIFLLVTLSILSGFLTGYNMARKKSKNLVHILSYVAVITITLYLIFDLELPRLGLLRVTPFDHQIIEINKI